MKKLILLCTMLGLLTATGAMAFEEKIKEYPIDVEKIVNRMKIAAVYLKPIDMEPRGSDLAASLADIHLEADIHAAPGNLNGFGVINSTQSSGREYSERYIRFGMRMGF